MINILALQHFTFFIHFHNLPTTWVQQTQTTDDLWCLQVNIIRKTIQKLLQYNRISSKTYNILCALPYYKFTRTSILVAWQWAKHFLLVAALWVFLYEYTRSMAMRKIFFLPLPNYEYTWSNFLFLNLTLIYIRITKIYITITYNKGYYKI